MTLQRLCSVDEVAVGEARRFTVGDREIAVVNLGDGQIKAVDAYCSHARFFLDEGEVDVEACSIECPRHGAVFDLETGKALALPATEPIDVFQVKIEDGDVLVEI